ncbi:MAG: hypothetical protein ACYTEL_01025 [Planctomycetota bacterium]
MRVCTTLVEWLRQCNESSKMVDSRIDFEGEFGCLDVYDLVIPRGHSSDRCPQVASRALVEGARACFPDYPYVPENRSTWNNIRWLAL